MSQKTTLVAVRHTGHVEGMLRNISNVIGVAGVKDVEVRGTLVDVEHTCEEKHDILAYLITLPVVKRAGLVSLRFFDAALSLAGDVEMDVDENREE